jgi:hypothetical protein
MSKHELDHQYRLKVQDTIQLAIKAAAYAICGISICVFAYLSIRELAGRTTLADVLFRAAADFRLNRPVGQLLAYLFGGGGVSYGVVQKILRRRYIEKWHPIIKEYEKLADPMPTSSNLTKTGKTQRGDK